MVAWTEGQTGYCVWAHLWGRPCLATRSIRHVAVGTPLPQLPKWVGDVAWFFCIDLWDCSWRWLPLAPELFYSMLVLLDCELWDGSRNVGMLQHCPLGPEETFYVTPELWGMWTGEKHSGYHNNRTLHLWDSSGMLGCSAKNFFPKSKTLTFKCSSETLWKSFNFFRSQLPHFRSVDNNSTSQSCCEYNELMQEKGLGQPDKIKSSVNVTDLRCHHLILTTILWVPLLFSLSPCWPWACVQEARTWWSWDRKLCLSDAGPRASTALNSNPSIFMGPQWKQLKCPRWRNKT